MWDGLEDVLPLNGSNHSNWPHKVTHYDYDIYTKTWEKLPYFECGDSPGRSVYYFAFNDYFYATSGGIVGMYFGAISVAQIWSSPPVLKYFFMLQTASGYTTRDGRELTIRFKNLPSYSAFWDLTGSAFAVKNEYIYEYDVYEDEDYLASYKMQIGFTSTAWEHTDIETGYHCEADYHAIPEYPFTKEKYIRFSIRIYNSDDEILREFTQSYQIPAVYSLACIQDIDYCVVGSCTYSNQGCEGCLVSSRVFVTQESTAHHLSGKCRRRSSLSYGMMSKSYRTLQCGFDTQADAHDYINANPNLEQSLQNSCAGKSWAIVGYCECDDAECQECRSKDSLSVKCEEDIKPCSSDKIKTHILKSGYKVQSEAFAYLNENEESLKDDLETACPSEVQYCRISVSFACGSDGWEKSSAGGSCETVEEPDTAGTWEGEDYESATYSIDIEGHCPDDCQAFAENYDPGEPPYECYSNQCPPGSIALDFWDGSSCGDAMSKFSWRCDEMPGWNFIKWVCREFPQYPPEYRYVVEMCCSHD
jgi:hypothetical protein